MVAIRCPFGGQVFEAPARVSAETLEKLESLVPFAPLHLPALIELARCCEEAFLDVPIIIVFETSFFAALPPYERRYGLDPGAATGSAPCQIRLPRDLPRRRLSQRDPEPRKGTMSLRLPASSRFAWNLNPRLRP